LSFANFDARTCRVLLKTDDYGSVLDSDKQSEDPFNGSPAGFHRRQQQQ
jgi:hypothetical protein